MRITRREALDECQRQLHAAEQGRIKAAEKEARVFDPNIIVPDRERFRDLADRWYEETRFLSGGATIHSFDSFLEIMTMGRAAIPLIIEELRHNRGCRWHAALKILTHEDPVPKGDRGVIFKMNEHWIRWAEQKGFA